MSVSHFLSTLLGGDTAEVAAETYYSDEEEPGLGACKRRGESEEGHRPLGYAIECIAEMIVNLPAVVSQESAVLIVRRTLKAAGVRISDLEAYTRAQESELRSEVELARAHQKEVSKKTQEVVRSLEEEIRKAREACENTMIYEEREISCALATLKELRRVRAFFELSKTEGEEDADPDEQGLQQAHLDFDIEGTQIFDTPWQRSSI